MWHVSPLLPNTNMFTIWIRTQSPGYIGAMGLKGSMHGKGN